MLMSKMLVGSCLSWAGEYSSVCSTAYSYSHKHPSAPPSISKVSSFSLEDTNQNGEGSVQKTIHAILSYIVMTFCLNAVTASQPKN